MRFLVGAIWAGTVVVTGALMAVGTWLAKKVTNWFDGRAEAARESKLNRELAQAVAG